MDDLGGVLSRFQEQVNQHARLRTLLRGWDKQVQIEASDTGQSYRLAFEDARLVAVTERAEGVASDIILRADAGTLHAMFDGTQNPATLFLNGELQVFATDKDQVKLDAIALVLWG
jgi:hypothetical protein